MTQYNMSNAGTIPFSDLTVQLALAANTLLTFTVPGTNSTHYRAEFSWNSESSVWVGYNTTAVSPLAGTILQNSNIELNPGPKFVRGGDTLSFISNALVTDAGLSLLLLPE